MRIELTFPLKATTTQNSRMHWAVRAKSVKTEHNRVLLEWAKARPQIEPTTRVTLTRVGPRALDSDNLAGSLKACRDAIAKKLRIDDGSPLITWSYRQETGPYAVRALIERAESP